MTDWIFYGFHSSLLLGPELEVEPVGEAVELELAGGEEPGRETTSWFFREIGYNTFFFCSYLVLSTGTAWLGRRVFLSLSSGLGSGRR